MVYLNLFFLKWVAGLLIVSMIICNQRIVRYPMLKLNCLYRDISFIGFYDFIKSVHNIISWYKFLNYIFELELLFIFNYLCILFFVLLTTREININ